MDRRSMAISGSLGFSLVELSIVLVILGLLAGGVLSGQSLIRAAELRSVTTEYQRYYSAASGFRDKYLALPGDMSNATAFWGKDATNCSTDSGGAGSPGTCNGNGDGIIDIPTAASTKAEAFQLWKQLALAGLIEGTYTGISGPGGAWDELFGINQPKSKLTKAGWRWGKAGILVGDPYFYAIAYGNTMVIDNGTLGTDRGVMKPEEAWNIDTKMDDGKPATGKITALGWNDDCGTGGADNTDTKSVYNLKNTGLRCALYFVTTF